MGSDSNQRLSIYKTILKQAVEKRKQSISAKELAEKLKIEPTSIYRLERGVNDMKLSTFLTYLDAFDYQIEIAPKNSLSAGKTNADYTANNGTIIDLEHGLINPYELDRRQRLRLLQYLIKLEETYINEGE
jgi:transcriptional regulator with XRE-family HTH domain